MRKEPIIPTVIRLGHSAYSRPNNYRLCFSRAEAVRILVMRGVSRDAARKAVKTALNRDHGYETVRGDYSNVVEVVNDSLRFLYEAKDTPAHAEFLRAKHFWATQPQE